MATRKLSRRQDPSKKIMKIREVNGGGGDTCPICRKPVAHPYRSTRDGETVYGCVDASHTGHVFGADVAWHWRQVSIKLRRDEHAALLAL